MPMSFAAALGLRVSRWIFRDFGAWDETSFARFVPKHSDVGGRSKIQKTESFHVSLFDLVKTKSWEFDYTAPRTGPIAMRARETRTARRSISSIFGVRSGICCKLPEYLHEIDLATIDVDGGE